MIISRTPYRISFFGGGTDYPAWYIQNGGSVLGSAIDKYCYITCRYLPPFFDHKLRVVYSTIENCKQVDEIKHPAVRETLRFLNITRGLEIHHDGDLPARSGMGSSSSFTVGLLNALYALQGKITRKKRLALESIHIEQNMINETVGSQDQVLAAYGNLNKIEFSCSGDIEVHPLTLGKERIASLNRYLMLFYTGIIRTASDVADSYVKDLQAKENLLRKMHTMVDEGISILEGSGNLNLFGELLHEAWLAKRDLSCMVSNSMVDEIYTYARAKGALGGKITGAGGGGFMLLFVPPACQKMVREALGNLIHVPFRFESEGSQIIFFDPYQKDYSWVEQDLEKRDIQDFLDIRDV